MGCPTDLVRPLSSELQKLAENTLNETPNRIKVDLQHIRDWLNKQPHMKFRTDDQWLIGFLRSSKFSLEITKRKLENFYLVKSLIPEYFSNRDPLEPEIQEVLKRGLILPLPKTVHPTAQRVILMRTGRADPQNTSLTIILKVLAMILEILFLEDDNYTIAGHYVIVDLQDLSYKYAAEVTPEFIKKLITAAKTAQPNKVSGVYYLNMPQFCVTIYNTMKVLFSDDIVELTHFCNQNDMEGVPLSILPNEYGGAGGCCDEISAQLKTKIESYRQWFLDEDQYGIDETKRPRHSKSTMEISYDFGLEGSFRSLNID